MPNTNYKPAPLNIHTATEALRAITEHDSHDPADITAFLVALDTVEAMLGMQ